MIGRMNDVFYAVTGGGIAFEAWEIREKVRIPDSLVNNGRGLATKSRESFGVKAETIGSPIKFQNILQVAVSPVIVAGLAALQKCECGARFCNSIDTYLIDLIGRLIILHLSPFIPDPSSLVRACSRIFLAAERWTWSIILPSSKTTPRPSARAASNAEITRSASAIWLDVGAKTVLTVSMCEG